MYAGVDETLKRRVALKAIRADDRLNAHSKARFLREAQILSQLDHPHICRVYNYVEGAGHHWLVLELIEGKTLHDAIRDGLGAAGRMAVAQQIAEVLVVTHAAGVVHRDLKPGNVMVTPAGGVKVLDFGLAQSLPADGAGGAATERPPTPGPASAAASRMAGRRPRRTRPACRSRRAADHRVLAFALRAGDRGRGAARHARLHESRAGPRRARDAGEQSLLVRPAAAGALHRTAAVSRDRRRRRPARPRPAGERAAASQARRRPDSPHPAPEGPAPAERPTAVDTLERLRSIAAKPRRRLRRVLVAAAITLAALAGVKYFADLRAERTVAVEARREAEERRKQAENLIGFMLGDLRKKLEKVGRLEILDDVGAKAMDYFAAVPESSLSDDELAQRSAALYRIGDVRITQGRLAEAEPPLLQSLTLARSWRTRHPDDGQRLFDLAQSHFWVGFVNWRQRRLDDALVHFREYMKIATRLVAIDASNVDWQTELASANSNIGSVLEEQGALDGALERFHAALDIESALLAKAPDDHSLRRNVAVSNNAVGAVLRAKGDLAESLSHHRAELALQEVVRLDPGRRAGGSTSASATAAWRCCSKPWARSRPPRRMRSRHCRSRPIWRPPTRRTSIGGASWAAVTTARGTIADAGGRRADAPSHLQQALAILARAAELDPRNPARQRDLAEVHAARAQHSLLEGDVPRAVAAAAAVQGSPTA